MRTCRALPLLLTVIAAACGDEDQGPPIVVEGNCEAFTACGGDVAGRWTLSRQCSDAAELQQVGANPFCRQATYDMTGMIMRGTMRFEADGRYNGGGSFGGVMKMTMPASCLGLPGGGTMSCAALTESIRKSAKGDPLFGGASCTGSADCTCAVTLKEQSATGGGTYAMSGHSLTLTKSKGGPESRTYCASANALTVGGTTTMSLGKMGTMLAKTYSVFTRDP